MKLAFLLNDNGDIAGINYTNDDGAEKQAQSPGWILIDAPEGFKKSELYKWVVRESDNALVHVDTNQTPEEEKNAVITNLTLQNLQQANEITELKKISTTQTLQSLQDAQDKESLRKVATSQAMQILELQKSVSDIKAGTTAN